MVDLDEMVVVNEKSGEIELEIPHDPGDNLETKAVAGVDDDDQMQPQPIHDEMVVTVEIEFDETVEMVEITMPLRAGVDDDDIDIWNVEMGVIGDVSYEKTNKGVALENLNNIKNDNSIV